MDETPKKELCMDEFLKTIGEFGRFQKLLVGILSIPANIVAFPFLIIYFTNLEPEWECAEGSTRCTMNGTFNSSDERRCEMSREDWQFTESPSFSLVTQYDLVCGRQWLMHLSSSIFFVGVAIGTTAFGYIADNYGRKLAIFGSVAVMITMMTVSPFLPSIELFIVGRFIIGFFAVTDTQSFVIINEYVGSHHRPIISNLLWVIWAVAECALPLKAYYINNWRMLYVLCSAPYAFVLCSWWFVPESARWLSVNGKTDEAMGLLRRVARFNNTQLPDKCVLECPADCNSGERVTFLDLFTSGRILAIRTLIQILIWVSIGLVYYGITIAAADLGGNLYINFVLGSLVEIPAYLICMWGVNQLGRKAMTISSMVASSLGCILVYLMPINHPIWGPLRIIVGTLSKLFVCINFSSIYSWSIELFPTRLRAIGFGFLVVMSQLGGAGSPWLAKALIPISPPLPFIVMGSVGLLTGMLMFLLPETKDLKTLEIVENQKNMDVVINNNNADNSWDKQ